MIKLIFSYIKNQSLQFKILLGVCVILFFVATGYAVKLSYSNYMLAKTQKQIIEGLQMQLTESEETSKKLITSLRRKTNQAKTRQSEIDNKLKQDEKIIDNDSITDDDIRSFITKHQER